MVTLAQETRRTKARLYGVAGVAAMAMIFASGLLTSTGAVKAPALKPLLGWNSYDCYGYGVTQAQFMANVHYMADNLKKYGWEYCVVDFIWWIPDMGVAGLINQNSNWNLGNLDQYGRFWPDTTRFPSAKGGRGFKPLADSVHNLGLKFGVHLMRGVPKMAVQRNCPIANSTYTCTQAALTSSTSPWLDWMYGAQNTVAGQAYITSMVNLCDSWGVDFLKVDDLSAATYHAAEVVMYANAIAQTSREIVFSTSPGPTPPSQASHVMQYANQWRCVNDLWDTWGQLTDSYQVAECWDTTLVNGKHIGGPGHWPDIDMLPFGRLSLYGPVGNSRYSLSTYTKGEHRLMLFLWCVDNLPMIYGGNMPDNKNDLFYDSLMMNSEAMDINQNGINPRLLQRYATASRPIWVSTNSADTSIKYVLMANLTSATATQSVTLSGLAYTGPVTVRDVWSQKSLGNFTTTFSQSIGNHNAGLYTLTPVVSTSERSGLKNRITESGEKTYSVTGNRFVIPVEFAGKTVRVVTYNLAGKSLNTIVTRGRSVSLYKGTANEEKIGIVKVSAF